MYMYIIEYSDSVNCARVRTCAYKERCPATKCGHVSPSLYAPIKAQLNLSFLKVATFTYTINVLNDPLHCTQLTKFSGGVSPPPRTKYP